MKQLTPFIDRILSFTISRALGINERDFTLTKSGDFLCRFLNMIEKDHCKNSI